MNEINKVNHMIENEMKCNPGVSIAAQCIVEIKGRFFLLVELEAKSGPEEFERVVVVELTAAAFQFLCEKGVKSCKVLPQLPNCMVKKIELRCAIVIGSHAYNIFEVEGKQGCDRLIVVKTSICKMCE